MKRALSIFLVATAIEAQQQNVVQRIADDALVFDRVAQASKRDLPRDLLKRIVKEDIELLRGKRRTARTSSRTSSASTPAASTKSFSIQPAARGRWQTVEMKGDWVYRVDRSRCRRASSWCAGTAPSGSSGSTSTTSPSAARSREQQSIEVQAVAAAGRSSSGRLPRHRASGHGERHRHGGGEGRLREHRRRRWCKARIVDERRQPVCRGGRERQGGPTRAGQRRHGVDARHGAADAVVRRRVDDGPGARGRGARGGAAGRSRRPTVQPEMQTELQMIEDLLTGTERSGARGWIGCTSSSGVCGR